MISGLWKWAGLALVLASCARQASPTTGAVAAHQKVSQPAPIKRPEPSHHAVEMNQRGKTSSIGMNELFALTQSGDVLLYDARPRIFYTFGHLPGAISLPKDEGQSIIDKHEAEIKAAVAAKKPIVVYCTNLLCPDARAVAMRLADRGFSCAIMGSGWDGWKEAGLPTE